MTAGMRKLGHKNGKKSKRRIFIIVPAVLCIIIAVLFAARKFKSGAVPTDAPVQVRSETYRNIIEIAGAISAAQSQTLQAAGTGSVTAIYVKEGDSIKKDGLILQLDDSEQRYNLSKHDYEMDQRRINGASRDLDLMMQQRRVLLQRIRDRQITASFDGVIAQFTAHAGDYLEAKDSVGIIVDRSYLKATVEVVETDAPKLQSGQKVTLRFPAYMNDAIEGRVVSFPAVGTITSRGATVVQAEIRIDNPPDVILPNYSFTGEIEITAPVTVLLVERRAIGYENGRAYAERILDGGKTERVPVRVEPYGRNFVSVISGLVEGDTLRVLQKSPESGTAGRRGQGQPQGGQGRGAGTSRGAGSSNGNAGNAMFPSTPPAPRR